VIWVAWGALAWLGGAVFIAACWALAKGPRSYYSPVTEAEAILTAHCECCSGS
jgi:hypothetical protein